MTQQPFESFVRGGSSDGANTIYVLGAQNREQAAVPQQLDVRINHEPMGHSQATPIPVPQASLPLTATPVETNPDNSAIA